MINFLCKGLFTTKKREPPMVWKKKKKKKKREEFLAFINIFFFFLVSVTSGSGVWFSAEGSGRTVVNDLSPWVSFPFLFLSLSLLIYFLTFLLIE